MKNLFLGILFLISLFTSIVAFIYSTSFIFVGFIFLAIVILFELEINN
jgi:hypothetical protein